MSEKLKLCSGAEAVKKFKRAGWTIVRQKGSHVMLVKESFPYTLSIPLHRELGTGILKKLIKISSLTAEEFNPL